MYVTFLQPDVDKSGALDHKELTALLYVSHITVRLSNKAIEYSATI